MSREHVFPDRKDNSGTPLCINCGCCMWSGIENPECSGEPDDPDPVPALREMEPA